MSSRSEQVATHPARDMHNIADWFRHLTQENLTQVFHAINDLKEVIPGLEDLAASEFGLGVRVFHAKMKTHGKPLKQPSPRDEPDGLLLEELSEGQRTLIALYLLLHCHLVDDATLVLDEPDNFIALAEIQPWLMKFLDRADELNAQVVFISHHPELLNQLAARGGVIFDRPNDGPTRVRPFDPADDSGLTPAELIARGWEGV